jgi:peptidoglycan/xylan/chitin deacetylase (PgdA/CDA1 family)
MTLLTYIKRSRFVSAALELPAVRAPLARAFAPVERLEETADWLVVAMYHQVSAVARAGLRSQLLFMRSLGDFVGVDDALELLRHPRRGRWFCLTFDDGLSGAFENAVPLFVEFAIPAAFFVVPSWIDAGFEIGRAAPRRMSWEDCRVLGSLGMTIGSHSYTHRRLSRLADAEARAEFHRSRARIEAETGRPCLHFAAPWGQPGMDYLPARDPVLAREAGYRSFFTTLPRRATAGTSVWTLPRIRLEPSWGEPAIRYALRRTDPALGASA